MIRSITRTITRAVRATLTPAALVLRDQAQQDQAPAVATAPEPTDLYTADELPPVEDIEAAAFGFDLAADAARSADRAKRKHRKLLDRLPAGLYGTWLVSRTPSSRQVADLEEITRIFKAHNLGPVPMKACAPSLKVTRAEVLAEVTA